MAAQRVATYRLQFNADFNFDDAANAADYLAALGVSHAYCSPYLQAAPHSTHGYDVVDPHRLSEELGGEPGHRRMTAALGRAGLSQILDIVPNHMAIGGRENLWWWDVLENGPASRHATYFDVDWNPPGAHRHDAVLIPLLDDHYGRVLEGGALRLEREGGAFVVRYLDHALPVSPRTIDGMLRGAAERCGAGELSFLADAFGRLPMATHTDLSSVLVRHRDKEVLRAYLARLCREQPDVGAAVDTVVAEINSDVQALDALLHRQNYRLTYWRVAEQEIGYRRFFDINTLVALRVEHDVVFADSHRLVLNLVSRGVLDGLRIDHVDGLRDPAGYLRRLHRAAPEAWIVVEKILARGESLPERWPIDGTTGYDFVNRAGGLFVDPAAEPALSALYSELTGETSDWPTVARAKRLAVLEQVLGGDVNRLCELFAAVCERNRRYRDYTRPELAAVLREVAAAFPVYRSYMRAQDGVAAGEDMAHVQRAVSDARAHRPDLDAALFDFFEQLLLLRVAGDVESELVLRFQQLTSTVMAKGVEDTAFYAYSRFVALNEVGGDPGSFGVSLEELHRAGVDAARRHPYGLLSTSTHDTKRGEDVRARLYLLSEMPGPWAEAVRRWTERNARHKKHDLPDRAMEYLVYQTLVGAWPLSVERLLTYTQKAAREAKTHTSWQKPNPAYESALRDFVTSILEDADFLGELDAFVQPLVAHGRTNSLAQTLLKLTWPGVPDIYQGTELWDFSLVDPDNRRPVDYGLRRRLLAQLDEMSLEQINAAADLGVPKLYLIREALALRRRRPEAFTGDYRPLQARGERAAHVVAYARGTDVVAIAPRLILSARNDWRDTALDLPEGNWRNVLTRAEAGERSLAALLARFPVALLERA